MKRIVIASFAFAFACVAVPAFAQSTPPAAAESKAPAADPKAAASYAGKWTMDVQSPQGAMQLGLEVKIDAANKVTGTLNGPNGPTPIAGEFKDDKLGFGINFDAGGQMIEIWFESALKDDKLAGTMYLGDMGNFPWTAARAK
jgi:hypothetical protein